MRKIFNQLSISDVYKNCKDLFDNDKPKFIALLEQTILGDSAFDKIDHYIFLKDIFKKVIIPLNPRKKSNLTQVGYNQYGYPLCPNNFVMKYCGITSEKGGSDRIKWSCPKVKMVKGEFACSCENPCSSAKNGRTTYTYENIDFRLLPGVVRDSEEWVSLYKIRTVIEKTINHLKTNMCVADRKSRNLSTTKTDLLLACISQLFTVIVADRIKNHKLLRSLKPLIA